jgi:hypothetical protein
MKGEYTCLPCFLSELQSQSSGRFDLEVCDLQVSEGSCGSGAPCGDDTALWPA